MTQPIRIAMWSGPRNISTAMLRSWGNRTDTFVVDEPLYSHFLSEVNIDHPGKLDIIASQNPSWEEVFDELTGPIPQNKAIYYQKHMTHHWLPHMNFERLRGLTNCFLIREPHEMLTSYIKVRQHPTFEDTGVPQQKLLFDWVSQNLDKTPAILDSRDVLENPRKMLSLLCEKISVPFSDNMLSWSAGKRDTDGVWAKYWYSSVEASTAFAPYKPKNEPVPDVLKPTLAQMETIYEELYALRLN